VILGEGKMLLKSRVVILECSWFSKKKEIDGLPGIC
jgi:hypothetical protein